MDYFDTKAHIFLWLSVPVILLMGLGDLNESMAINIHDTYFVISNWDLALVISVYFAMLGLIYWSLIKAELKPVRWLTLTHLFFTIDISFFIWLVLFFNWFSQTNSSWISPYSDQDLVVISCLGLFMLGQMMFILNILLTVAFRRSASSG